MKTRLLLQLLYTTTIKCRSDYDDDEHAGDGDDYDDGVGGIIGRQQMAISLTCMKMCNKNLPKKSRRRFQVAKQRAKGDKTLRLVYAHGTFLFRFYDDNGGGGREDSCSKMLS